MPGRLTRLNALDTARTSEQPRPRLKPRGLPPALEPHGIYAATNPADAALYGHDVLGPHRVHVAPEDLGTFTCAFHAVLIRDVTLGYLDYATEVRVEARALPEHYLVIVPAAGSSTIATRETMVEASPVMAAIPAPGRPMTLHSEADAAHLIVRIERQALETHLSRLLGRTIDRPIEFEPAFDLSTGAATRWNFAVQMLHGELYEKESLLHRAAGLGSLEEFLMSALLYSQPSSYSEQLTTGTSTPGRVVQTAIDYIERNLAADISVRDVAAAAEVSVRTLQNQFAADLDQTPTAYLRNRRLERARSDLADASTASGLTVTDVASRWGFTHLGRFAGIYRSRFGESPSQTLRS